MKKLIFSIVLTVIALFTVQCTEKEKDTTPPVITLLGSNPMSVALDSAYVEPGFVAIDDVDGDLNSVVRITGSVNTAAEGDYTLLYNVYDSSGNAAEEVIRTVYVRIF
jgi:hypothetical protein